MAPVSLKASSRGITILIIVAVAIFFGCVLVYLGAAGKLNSVNAELKSKQEKVQASRKIAQTLEESRLRFLDTRAQIRYLETSVSTHAYVPTLLKQIENLGKSVNLRVVAVRPKAEVQTKTVRRLSSGAQASEGKVEAASESKADPLAKEGKEAEPKHYDELGIQISLRGKYMNALDFLYRLTSFPKIISVNSVNLRSIERSDNMPAMSPNLDITIEATAFVFRDQDSGSLMEVPETQSGHSPGRPAVHNESSSRTEFGKGRERRAGNEAG